MRTIPNALDLRDVDALTDPARAGELRRQHHLELGERVLLSVGRLEASKGFHVLLRALGALRDHGALDGRPWRWVVARRRPVSARCWRCSPRSWACRSASGFSGACRITRCTPGTSSSTLFVHPTLYEGSSLVTLEAMAHRRAVVASRGGRPSRQGAPGRERLARRAGRSLGARRGDQRRPRRSGAARALRPAPAAPIVEREFSWTAAGDATVALYRELLG